MNACGGGRLRGNGAADAVVPHARTGAVMATSVNAGSLKGGCTGRGLIPAFLEQERPSMRGSNPGRTPGPICGQGPGHRVQALR
jgi:hypothetical protein